MVIDKNGYILIGICHKKIMQQYRVQRKRNKLASFSILLLFLILINIWAMYLIIDLKIKFIFYILLYLSILILSILSLIFLIRYIKSIKLKGNRLLGRDLFQLSIKYLKINNRHSIVAILGIIIAMIILSQTVLLGYNYKEQQFEKFVNNDIPIATYSTYRLTMDNYEGVSDLINNEVINDFNQRGISINKTSSYLYSSTYIDLSGNNNASMDDIEWFNLMKNEIEYINLLNNLPSVQNSGITYTINDTLLIVPYYDLNYNTNLKKIIDLINNNKTISVVPPQYYGYIENGEEIPNMNITIDKVILLSNEDIQFIYSSQILITNWGISFDGIFVNDKLFFDVLSFMKQFDEYDITLNIILAYFTDMPLEYSKMNELMDDLRYSTNKARNSITPRYGGNLSSPLLTSINWYIEYTATMNFTLIISSIPFLILSAFLVYFSLSLIQERKNRILTIIKARGASSDQIKSFIISEVLYSGIMAVSVGMVLSIPWTQWLLQTYGLFNFSISVNIPYDWYWKLPIIGMIATIDLNIPHIQSINKINIDEGEITMERKKPLWQKIYLDLILFSVSLLFWIILRAIHFNEQTKEVMVYFFGPILYIILLLSAPLVIARYFNTIIGYFAGFLWTIKGGIASLATKNLQKNKFSSSKLVALIMLGTLLTLMSFMLPYTFEQYAIEQTHYDLGADIVVDKLSINDSETWNKINITGVASISNVARLSFEIQDDIYGYMNFVILGINTSTFANTLFWKNDYDSKPLSKITDQISNESIGIPEAIAEAMKLEIGDLFYLNLDYGYFLNVSTTFKYMPSLVKYLPYKDYDGRYYVYQNYILADISLVEKMAIDNNLSINYKTYVKVKEGYNATAVAVKLEEQLYDTKYDVISANEAFLQYWSSYEVSIIMSLIGGLYIISILVAIIGVSYFTYITLKERKREIGVFKALGMVKSQIFFMIIFESMIIVISGVIFGLLFGYYMTSNLIWLMNADSYNNPPIVRLMVPYGRTLAFITSLLFFVFLASYIPAKKIANQATRNVLRAE